MEYLSISQSEYDGLILKVKNKLFSKLPTMLPNDEQLSIKNMNLKQFYDLKNKVAQKNFLSSSNELINKEKHRQIAEQLTNKQKPQSQSEEKKKNSSLYQVQTNPQTIIQTRLSQAYPWQAKTTRTVGWSTNAKKSTK